ncbi:hypothetical protein NOJ05_13530 [Neorhizobium galegae]|uniref:hypothetical protein n=1 Tax=Neorhizobium galegae TaxID=399 RepID=UPI002102C7D6|nr:hypothetical protein [Neorhizobium galegae]MCQ1778223.1 hypothetical protein [Neorhizobium galegae]MCQ1796803.1 hypothetical protein [Neorhizobium galegae]
MLTPSLMAAMATFATADAAFRAIVSLDVRDDEQSELLWCAKEAAELDVIRHPCLTIDDVRAKARLAIHDENVFHSISNCTINGEHELHVFLRSLFGEPEADVIKPKLEVCK